MKACQQLEFDTVDKLLASGKSLANYKEPSEMLMRLLQAQTIKSIKMSNFKVQGVKGISKDRRLITLGVFMLLLKAGADQNAMRIKGFKKAGTIDLGSGAVMHSTGNPGIIVPAHKGGMSALEFAEINNLMNFKKLLLKARARP